MKIKQVFLTERQHQWLATESERTGLSAAEIIRRVLDAAIDDGIERDGRENR